MTAYPAANYISNAARTEGEGKTFYEDLLAIDKEVLGGAPELELTIATGSVAPTQAVHIIDTESDASVDDLTNAVVTNHPAGRFLLLHAADPGRIVTVVHLSGGSGEFSLQGGVSKDLADDAYLLFILVGTVWTEVLIGGRPLSAPDAGELTIATGVITVTGAYHTVDTQADAGTDNLDTINGGFAGARVVLQAEDATHTIVVKDGTGNIQLAGDYSLDNAQDTLELIYSGALSAWCELSRSDNGV